MGDPMSDSPGDPRVLFVMNLVLSVGFAAFVVWGLSILGLLSFSWTAVAVGTGLLMVLTYFVVW